MRADEVTIDWLLPQLDGVEGGEGQYAAWCPCHDDFGSVHKGLSITEKNGKVYCHCHSPQCSATLPEVLAALNGSLNPNGWEPHVVMTPVKRPMQQWVEKTGVSRDIWEK